MLRALAVLASLATTSVAAHQLPETGRVFAAGFSLIPPHGWDVKVFPPSKGGAGLGGISMVTGLEEGDGHARSISVGGMLLSREAADSGAEWWVSAQRAD